MPAALPKSAQELSLDDLRQLKAKVVADKKMAKTPDELKVEEIQSLRKVLRQGQEKGFGQEVLEVAAEVGEFVDRFTGAPTRAAIGSLQDDITRPDKAVGAFITQFGDDPRKAPTGKEIAAKTGLSTDEYIEIPLLSRLVGDVSPAGVAGFAIDVVADPLSLLPSGAISKGAKTVTRMTGKTIKGAGRYAIKGTVAAAKKAVPETVEQIARATKYISEKFKPAIAADAGEFLRIAKKNNIELTDEVIDLIDFDKTSTVNRMLRKQAEGTIGEKLMKGAKNAALDVSNAIENFKNKFSIDGQAISEISAGDIIKLGMIEAKDQLFKEIDITYDTLGKMLNKIAPGRARASLMDVDPKLMGYLKNKLDPIRRQAQNIAKYGGKRRKAEANEILDFIKNLDEIEGDLTGLVLQLREVGENAFGKIIVGQPTVNTKLSKDLYFALSDTLIETTKRGMGKEAAEGLIKNNRIMHDFFSDENIINKALRSDPAPEKLYKSLVLNGDSKTISALKEVLTPEKFNQLKNAFIDSISPKNMDDIVSFKTIFNTIKRNKKNVFQSLFEVNEQADLLDILRLGERLNLPFMSLSGTGGSNTFMSVVKQMPDEIINDKILESLKATARGTAKESTDELVTAGTKRLKASAITDASGMKPKIGLDVPQSEVVQVYGRQPGTRSKITFNRPPILGGKPGVGRTAAKTLQMLSIDRTNRRTPIERRLERRSK